jgi:hypothetical protein
MNITNDAGFDTDDIIMQPEFVDDADILGKNGLPKLSKHIFWDCVIKNIDFSGQKDFVIERVFKYGFFDDMLELFYYYGEQSIKETVVNIHSFDAKTLNYISCILHIPKRNFKCYTKSLSNSPFLNFC